MPGKVIFYEEDFLEYQKVMLASNFRPITTYEFRTELRLANVIAPSKRTGREEGFTYFSLGLRVIVWVSYVASEGATRQFDAGRVLILENNKPTYFGTFVHRTKYFFERMYVYSLAAMEHVASRPTCSKCGNLMSIFQYRKGGRRCFWHCKNPDHKGKGPTVSWKHGLSDKTKKYLLPKWSRAAKYYAKLRAEGKEPGKKRESRRGWKQKNPD